MSEGQLVRLETREPVFSGANRVVVDWDGTCVENAWPDMGDWLPGAVDALRRFLDAGLEVVILSTRLAPVEVDEVTPRPVEMGAEVGNVRRMLNDAGLNEVEIWLHSWKPGAVAYIDDKAIVYKGDWGACVRDVEGMLTAAAGERERRPQPRAGRHPNSARFHEIIDELSALHDRKQADYGRGDDPFANVRASEEWGVPPWVGAMVRANDKVRRLQSLIQNGKLENESAEDSLRDLAVYAVIALVLFEQEGR